MAGLRIPPHVVDRILNHTSGTIRGVARVYNRFEYAEERKSALEAWGRAVNAIVEGSKPQQCRRPRQSEGVRPCKALLSASSLVRSGPMRLF